MLLRSAEVKPLFYRFVQHLLNFSFLTVHTLEGRQSCALRLRTSHKEVLRAGTRRTRYCGHPISRLCPHQARTPPLGNFSLLSGMKQEKWDFGVHWNGVRSWLSGRKQECAHGHQKSGSLLCKLGNWLVLGDATAMSSLGCRIGLGWHMGWLALGVPLRGVLQGGS